jgi:hypothetical protein
LRNRTSVIVCLLFILIAGSFALAQVPSIPPFSADMKTSGSGGHDSTGKMYWGGSRIRMDMNSQGQNVSMINDMPKKTGYMIMHQQRMYMEITAGNPMSQRMRAPDIKPYDPANPCASREGYTCKKVGTETVNGRSCDKWEITGPQSKQTVWIDQKLHFPIRSVSSDGNTMDLTNVKEGSQPASLFEVPAGYSKMDLGGMMGGQPRE